MSASEIQVIGISVGILKPESKTGRINGHMMTFLTALSRREM